MKKIGYPEDIKFYSKSNKTKQFKLDKTQTKYVTEKLENNGGGGKCAKSNKDEVKDNDENNKEAKV